MKLPNVDGVLTGKNAGEILGEISGARRDRPLSETELKDAERLYQPLLRIGRSYCLTTSEFEYYCTTSSPRARSNGDDDGTDDWVFHPYHILSWPHQMTIGWDKELHRTATKMLRIMRTDCNKPAKKAGLGEPGVDARVVICWLAAFFSAKIKTTYQGTVTLR